MADARDPAALLTDLPAAAAAVASGRMSSAALVGACLARIDEIEPRVRAFSYVDAKGARRRARDADARIAAGGALGPLHGVPVGIKDILDTAGLPTEHGSPLFAGRVPERSAGAVLNLQKAGAIMMGKTVTTEFAYFFPGPTRNPWDQSRTPGGSSMGSAAGVACGMLPAAVGTQTNGSVIRPAAFCGVVGFKPTRGRIPGDGMLVFSQTLDQVGSFARTVAGAGMLATATAGEESWAALPDLERPRFVVARTAEWGHAEPAMQAQFEADIAALMAAGATVEEVPLPAGLEAAVPVHRTIMAAEAFENLGELALSNPDKVSEVLRRFVEEGRAVSNQAYRDALAERQRLIAAYMEWMRPFDALLTPPTTGEAPGPETTGDPRFCTRWTLLGAPALTLPTGLGPHGLPLGLQLVGAPGEDARLLAAAEWVEVRRPGPGAPPI